MEQVSSLLGNLGYPSLTCCFAESGTANDLRVYFYTPSGKIRITYVHENNIHDLGSFLEGTPQLGPANWPHPIEDARAPEWVVNWLAPFRPETLMGVYRAATGTNNQRPRMAERSKSVPRPSRSQEGSQEGFQQAEEGGHKRCRSAPRSRKVAAAWGASGLIDDPRWSTRRHSEATTSKGGGRHDSGTREQESSPRRLSRQATPSSRFPSRYPEEPRHMSRYGTREQESSPRPLSRQATPSSRFPSRYQEEPRRYGQGWSGCTSMLSILISTIATCPYYTHVLGCVIPIHVHVV